MFISLLCITKEIGNLGNFDSLCLALIFVLIISVIKTKNLLQLCPKMSCGRIYDIYGFYIYMVL